MCSYYHHFFHAATVKVGRQKNTEETFHKICLLFLFAPPSPPPQIEVSSVAFRR